MTKERLLEDIESYYKTKKEDANSDTSLLDMLSPEERKEWNVAGQQSINELIIEAKQYGILTREHELIDIT